MMRAENGLKNEKSGGDRDIPLLPTRRAYDFTVTRRINGREEKRSPRGGAEGEGEGERSRPRAVTKSRSQEVACPPRRDGVPSSFSVTLRRHPLPPWPSGLPPVASVFPLPPVTPPLATRHGLDRRPCGHLSVSQAQ